jgi:hypothetical protein
MPRTTLNLDASVLREARRRAKEQGKSIGDVVSEALGPAFVKKGGARADSGFRWRTARMSARVDLGDKEAVRRALGER